MVVCQEEVQGEVELLEVPCLGAGVGHTLMGRPCNKIAQIQFNIFVEWTKTFQRMKEGHQAEVQEALHQEEPGYIFYITLGTQKWDPTSIPGGAMLPSSPSSLASL